MPIFVCVGRKGFLDMSEWEEEEVEKDWEGT